MWMPSAGRDGAAVNDDVRADNVGCRAGHEKCDEGGNLLGFGDAA